MTVRRIKTYSAQTGFVYQYHFEELRSPHLRAGRHGSEYIFMVSRDRKNSLPVAIFLRQDAVKNWAAGHGRELTGSEQYAAVKMRLFRFFDESEDWEAERLSVEVAPENIEDLLSQLDVA
ncbi:MAG: hypothetical protein ACRD4D_02560 [Candidatus Acidiferrales bacterium]